MTSAIQHGSRSVSSRLLAVLDTFDSSAQELTLSEISRRSGQPLPTTHRFVGELVRWGALERGTRGGYRIGTKLWELASRAPRTEGLRQDARPVLHDLATATGLTVRLAIADGTDALCVEVISRGARLGAGQRPGSRLPLHATGVGKVLLAYGGTGLLQSVLSTGPCRFTPYTLPPGLLIRALARIRAGEVARACEEHRLGEVELAVPVTQPGDRWPRSASCAVPARPVCPGLRRCCRPPPPGWRRPWRRRLPSDGSSPGNRAGLMLMVGEVIVSRMIRRLAPAATPAPRPGGT